LFGKCFVLTCNDSSACLTFSIYTNPYILFFINTSVGTISNILGFGQVLKGIDLDAMLFFVPKKEYSTQALFIISYLL
jgi:hypothetical protein